MSTDAKETLKGVCAILLFTCFFGLAIFGLGYLALEDNGVPCMTDAGTMSYSATVCEKYGR